MATQISDTATFQAGDALADLSRLTDAIGGETMHDIITEQTDLMHSDAQSRARFGRSGRYREAIKKKVFKNPDGFAGTVFVIQGPWSRNPSKLWPKVLPIWLEHGTRKMDPRPHLIPAWNVARERINRAVDRALEKFAS